MSDQCVPTGPCRERYFHERTEVEKVVKLAEAVDYLTAKLKEALDALDQLKEHQHAGNLLVVPMRDEGETRPYRHRGADSYFFKNPLNRERDLR